MLLHLITQLLRSPRNFAFVLSHKSTVFLQETICLHLKALKYSFFAFKIILNISFMITFKSFASKLNVSRRMQNICDNFRN